jgi:hypothetical protein
MRWLPLLLLTLFLLLVTGCSGAGEGDPVGAVERYLQAKVAADGEAMAGLLCSEMEASLERESRTFDRVSDVRLEGMACEPEEDGATVRCAGRIVALYGAEETEFLLGAYRVVQEDGEWKWCGEAP